MSDKFFWRRFTRRSLLCFLILISLLFVTVLRITVISTSNYSEVQSISSSLKIKLFTPRGTIFDCNMNPITNTKKKIIACISPTPQAITTISQILEKNELDGVLNLLKSGKPAVIEVTEKIYHPDIYCTEIYTQDKFIPAIHTVGYTDSQGNGVSGIQKAFNDLLKSQDEVYLRYACDGKGRVLSGVRPEIYNNYSPYSNSLVTTIDLQIQAIVEELSNNIGCGAVIVADAKTAKIRAIASRPNFTIDTIETLLNHEDAPLFNRSLGAYSVGSIFKPCVAAAAIENNLGNFSYTCTGSFEIIDRIFRCHEHQGHGLCDMNLAIANSCNTYFYNLGLNVKEAQILKYANILNFGKSIRICKNISTAKGNVPTAEKLKNTAHLANFSIGQGEFSASPISLLPLYCAIANDGEYYIPSIIESTTQNGLKIKYDIGYPTKAFNKNTAQKLKQALALVIEEGTGTLAAPKTVTAGGKTATAQTGKFKNGVEINSSWFCGFFPLKSPKYVVIVFSEDTKKQTKTCAEIFSQIADQITALK